MKRATILIALIIICSTGKAQNRASLLFTGEYVYQPSLQLNGGGYTLALQKNIQPWLFLEGGASFAIASAKNPRDEIVAGVQMLDLNYHAAAYTFYIAAGTKITFGNKLNLDLYAGPLTSYQSNLIDVYHYKILEEPDYISNYPDEIYSNKSEEGLFVGGVAGFRCSVFLSSKWSINLGGSIKGIIHAESLVNTSLGFSYHW